MSDQAGRLARLIRPLLLVALLAVNGGLLGLNLRKHQVFPFDSTKASPVAGSDSDASAAVGSAPEGDDGGIGGTETEDPAVDLGVDDWPGGRGPVPGGQPQPLGAILNSDGTLVLTGSVPSWAAATDLAERAAAGLAGGDWDGDGLDGEAEAITIDYTWHPESSARALGGVVLLNDPVLYRAGQVGVPPEASPTLDLVAALVADHPTALVTVTAYVDDLGDTEENATVAVARISAVASHLEASGVERSTIVMAIAPEDPGAVPNDSEQERAFNRRVEIGVENFLAPVTGSALSRLSAVEEFDASTATQPTAAWSIDGALIAGSDCDNPVAGPPLRVGYAADFSLLGAAADIAGSEAVKHLANLINCSGGVAGQPVEVLVVDVGGSPLAARIAIRSLLDWQPNAIIGPRSAVAGLRLLQATANRIPVVSATSNEPALADPSKWSFLASADAAVVADAAAAFAINQGWLTAAIFSAPGPDFGYGPAAFAAAYEAAGGSIAANAEFVVGRPESTGVAVSRLALGPAPDVIVSVMPADQFVALKREVAAAGIETVLLNADPLSMPGPVVGDSADGSTDISPDSLQLGDLEGSFAVVQVPPRSGSRSIRLDQSFRAATGFSSASPTAAALAGDALSVIIEAYLKASDRSPAGLANALSGNLTVSAVTGTLVFDGAGSPAKVLYVARSVDGTLEPVARIDPN